MIFSLYVEEREREVCFGVTREKEEEDKSRERSVGVRAGEMTREVQGTNVALCCVRGFAF